MRRWWTIPLSGVLFLLLIVSLVGAVSLRARSREWCGLENSWPRADRIRSVRTDWTWSSPGFDCVYIDGRGHELARRRAMPP